MSDLAKIADVVEFVDTCLAESDWDRLAALTVPTLSDVPLEDPAEIHDALEAVHAMRHRIQQRMDAITSELEGVPAVRKATKAYVAS